MEKAGLERLKKIHKSQAAILYPIIPKNEEIIQIQGRIK